MLFFLNLDLTFKDRKSLIMELTSDKSGTLCNLTVSFVNKLDARMGKEAFFEPLIFISPEIGFPPIISIWSM